MLLFLFRDIEFVSLCTDDEGDENNGTTGAGDDDMEVEIIAVSGKRKRLVSMDTSPIRKKPHLSLPEPDPDNLSFNPLDQTAIHPASYHIATA